MKPQSNQVVKYWKDLPVSTLNQHRKGGSTHLGFQMQEPTSELSFHLLGILHLEAARFSFLGWFILSLCQMPSVTILRELLGPMASLSMSRKELHKQPTAVLAYGYHHSAPQTSYSNKLVIEGRVQCCCLQRAMTVE